MSEHEHWQLDGSAPELYERYLVPAITSLWSADLIDRAMPKSGEAALDIACGTGAVTRLAAERMASGRVVGLDFNPGMLAVARSVPNSGTSIEWFEGSALSLPFDDGSFNLVLCQLGLQFFPDRSLALREMNRVLAPSGRVALSVYSAIEHTPAANAFVQALDQRLGPDASKIKRAEHIFPEADEVGALMTQEGFEQVDVNTVTQRITFPSVLDYVRFQLIATPMASLLSDRNDDEREALIKNVAAATQSLLDPEMLRNGRLSFPQEAHVAMALRSG
ncbi:class I SAM-dependent methyltransferase [Mesorhizobium sp. AR10]|uniref:class I SAM-dependent methyltransferase n=1 Tax=Mesorhizobium sp. AR10 TaxID=2865839 RepID=UPI00215E03A0|nr:class I SAM-dependent methyltransferase [Mesorhizobium sp. AR10]UVK39685.1 class I SAM-dependent methyltransferase [Mesorhizobium sp. AR10]